VTRLSTSGFAHIFDQLIDEVLSAAIAIFRILMIRAIRNKGINNQIFFNSD